ncbi:MAG: OadG family protein [Eubacteriales bacterium]|nr:OadG family protein [Eubacteriales bacterium]
MCVFLEAGEAATASINNAEPTTLMTILLGFGTVFIGLICLIFIIKLYSLLCKKLIVKDKGETVKVKEAPAIEQPIENRQQLIAAVSAVIATVMGTNVDAVRIKSFKKVS